MHNCTYLDVSLPWALVHEDNLFAVVVIDLLSSLGKEAGDVDDSLLSMCHTLPKVRLMECPGRGCEGGSFDRLHVTLRLHCIKNKYTIKHIAAVAW